MPLHRYDHYAPPPARRRQHQRWRNCSKLATSSISIQTEPIISTPTPLTHRSTSPPPPAGTPSPTAPPPAKKTLKQCCELELLRDHEDDLDLSLLISPPAISLASPIRSWPSSPPSWPPSPLTQLPLSPARSSSLLSRSSLPPSRSPLPLSRSLLRPSPEPAPLPLSPCSLAATVREREVSAASPSCIIYLKQ